MPRIKIYYDDMLHRWVIDNGHETMVSKTWQYALRMAAYRYYGTRGLVWWHENYE